jgi:phycocyanobilin:ferredoxin oxidoreductase
MWNKFRDLTKSLDIVCEGYCGHAEERGPWHRDHINKFYSSVRCELAHTSVVDLRAEKGLWMMHTAFFSARNYPMPVYGFDVIVGKNKVTGCFHDISPTTGGSPIDETWKKYTHGFEASRKRELPEWANFFSDNMVVMGATADEKEIDQVCHIGLTMANAWFKALEEMDPTPSEIEICTHEQGKMLYCEGQLKNERSKDVMTNVLGMEREYVERFKRIQFPF